MAMSRLSAETDDTIKRAERNIVASRCMLIKVVVSSIGVAEMVEESAERSSVLDNACKGAS